MIPFILISVWIQTIFRSESQMPMRSAPRQAGSSSRVDSSSPRRRLTSPYLHPNGAGYEHREGGSRASAPTHEGEKKKGRGLVRAITSGQKRIRGTFMLGFATVEHLGRTGYSLNSWPWRTLKVVHSFESGPLAQLSLQNWGVRERVEGSTVYGGR